MSIILALTSGRDGVVASDGRRFHSVHLVNGVPSEPASVSTDEFNKTFSLNGGNVVGAFCGLLEFSGATVAEHIADITSNMSSACGTFLSLVIRIEEQLRNRLNEIDTVEVIPSCRNVDLQLVGGACLTRADVRIAAVRFCAGDDGVTTSRELVSAGRANRYYTYGDDQAVAGASAVLNANRAPNKDAKFLLQLARRAIEFGIRNCGTHPHGTERACGGKTFTARTWY